jgi:phospho-N-acetylmuramoyl-pentapeptide-transferase
VFYHFLYPLSEYVGLFNVFRYITFRSAYAAATALIVSLLLGPYVLRRLRELNVGQVVRDDGPASHKAKAGTPTMGGILILASILTASLLWADLTNRYIQLVLVSTVWLGLIGFVDDYFLTSRGKRNGLQGRYKLFAQIALGLFIGIILYLAPQHPTFGTSLNIPFLKHAYLRADLGWFYIPFAVMVIVGASNAVNLSDGLDGLAIGLVIFVAATLAVVSYISGHFKFSEYLNILFLRGSGELAVFCAAITGAALGFLWLNCHPAELFMGDTGALALGGALGTVAVLIKRELLLAIIGALFVVEALSVIIQVLSYRLRKKRVFRMAPLHHHFEMAGWAEPKVVVRFWIVGALLALVSISTLKLQ